MNEYDEIEEQLPNLVDEFTKQLPKTEDNVSNLDKQWPKTVDEAVGKILQVLNEKDKEKIKNYQNKWDMLNYHMSLGMWIRNEFGLWKGNKELLVSIRESHADRASDEEPMVLAIRQQASGHPDTASTAILIELWEALQEQGRE
jgi:hypothetical protein